jgi:hypothetical protein
VQPNELNYGSFATYAHDGYLYLLSSDNTGIQIARVSSDLDKIGDRTKVINTTAPDMMDEC